MTTVRWHQTVPQVHRGMHTLRDRQDQGTGAVRGQNRGGDQASRPSDALKGVPALRTCDSSGSRPSCQSWGGGAALASRLAHLRFARKCALWDPMAIYFARVINSPGKTLCEALPALAMEWTPLGRKQHS